jgi:hypothetical protein
LKQRSFNLDVFQCVHDVFVAEYLHDVKYVSVFVIFHGARANIEVKSRYLLLDNKITSPLPLTYVISVVLMV